MSTSKVAVPPSGPDVVDPDAAREPVHPPPRPPPHDCDVVILDRV
jgi:hypothetical protein